ncbi:hypothetical protein CKO28_13220 [Rhodovibrio sodomensis]|uniref:Histidine kinase/HSP90-like ATPase domain-containing protein n=1 Tax=Rhodovibrio sodomensis TaxID=1088 RepID=A0ABS1DGC4_9PROT|nr:ATP-binding protein [Rhodovibrio sodomensis]MBK1668992.1 hypothetical protein [Rhodovibrio sodomensis]
MKVESAPGGGCPVRVVAGSHRPGGGDCRATEGSGPGLAIVDWLARTHGARPKIDSAPDAGTEMRLYFRPLGRSNRRFRLPGSLPSKRWSDVSGTHGGA